MKLIVAVDKEWGIGYRGELLARVREDLRRFRALTEGKTVILGSNTLATFPGGKVLKNRTNFVLHPDINYRPEGAVVMHSIEELLRAVQALPPEDVFVIGGASVYRQLLPYVDTAYVTKFDRSFEKDAYFPNLDESSAWECVWEGEPLLSCSDTDSVPDLPFRFTEYRRVAPERA